MTRELSTTKVDLKKYPIFLNIKNKIARFDRDLHAKNLDHILSTYNSCIELCEKLKKIAISNNDEYCANVSFFLKTNILLIKSIAQFWKLCEEFDYPNAWSNLQDALAYCRTLLKFCDMETAKVITSIYEYLSLIEKLFPYSVFASSAFEDIETKCSICGKTPFDPSCSHITGELYWGEMATNVVVNIKKMDHIAFVPNPVDKRCIMFIEYDKKNPEQSRFKHIYSFIKQSKRPLRSIKIQKSERVIPRSKFKNKLKKWPCPCGSEIPFEECCYDKDIIKIPHIDIFYDDED